MSGTTVINHIRPFRPAGSGRNLDWKKTVFLVKMQIQSFSIRLMVHQRDLPPEKDVTLGPAGTK